jgi:hypothetical protein
MNLAIRRLFDYDVLDDERFFNRVIKTFKIMPFLLDLKVYENSVVATFKGFNDIIIYRSNGYFYLSFLMETIRRKNLYLLIKVLLKKFIEKVKKVYKNVGEQTKQKIKKILYEEFETYLLDEEIHTSRANMGGYTYKFHNLFKLVINTGKIMKIYFSENVPEEKAQKIAKRLWEEFKKPKKLKSIHIQTGLPAIAFKVLPDLQEIIEIERLVNGINFGKEIL